MHSEDNAGPDKPVQKMQADQGLHCPLTESMDSVVYANKQRMLSSDCTDAHADLDLECRQIVKGPFSCIAH